MKRLLIAVTLLASAAHAEIVPGVSGCMYRSEVQKLNGQDVTTGEASVCVEEPPVEVKKVKIGDLVRIGQVQSHPVIKQPFIYRGTTCWWFSEPATRGRDLVVYQGIMCEVKPNVWRVIDKF